MLEHTNRESEETIPEWDARDHLNAAAENTHTSKMDVQILVRETMKMKMR